MARLLEPAAFGLLAMAMAALRFGTYFGQMGVGAALVQKKDLSDTDVRASFTSSAILGAFFFGAFWIAAPFIGRAYGTLELVPILRVLAGTFILQNLGVTAQALLRREMRFRPLSLIEMSTYVAGYCLTGITMALAGWGVWSLVGATLAQGLLAAISLNIVVRHSYVPALRWRHYRTLYSFGGKVSLISFFEFLSSSLDTFIIGALSGARPLGIYNRAQMLARLPLQLFSSSISRVLFPAWSSVQGDKDKLRGGYLMVVRIAGSVLLAMGFGMAVAAPEIVAVLLGPGWRETVPILRILAVAIPVHLVTHFSGVLLESQGELNVKLVAQIVYLVLLGLLFSWFRRWDLIGFAVALLCGVLALNAFYAIVVTRLLRISARELAVAYAWALITGVATATAILAASRAMESLSPHPAVMLIAQVVVGAAAMVATLLLGPQRSDLMPLLLKALPIRLDGSLIRLVSRWRPAKR